MRDDARLNHSVNSGDREKWSHSEDILKRELARLSTGLGVE